jgi:hypothetical protein
LRPRDGRVKFSRSARKLPCQALDLEDVSAPLQRDDAFFERNPFIGRTLQTHPKLEHVLAFLDERGETFAVEDWRAMYRRYLDYCEAHGIEAADLARFDEAKPIC